VRLAWCATGVQRRMPSGTGSTWAAWWRRWRPMAFPWPDHTPPPPSSTASCGIAGHPPLPPAVRSTIPSTRAAHAASPRSHVTLSAYHHPHSHAHDTHDARAHTHDTHTHAYARTHTRQAESGTSGGKGSLFAELQERLGPNSRYLKTSLMHVYGTLADIPKLETLFAEARPSPPHQPPATACVP
jgi:hypothetical protein